MNLQRPKGLEKIGALLCLTGIFTMIPASLALFVLAHPYGAAELLSAVLKLSLVIILIGGSLIGWAHYKKNT